MLGNVWEWVEDVCTCDPKRRIMKGGSFYNISRDLRVPNRETPLDGLQHRNIGFRCVANSLPLASVYLFFPVFTGTTLTVGTTIGRRIGTSPAPGCCCCCIRVSISVRT